MDAIRFGFFASSSERRPALRRHLLTICLVGTALVAACSQPPPDEDPAGADTAVNDVVTDLGVIDSGVEDTGGEPDEGTPPKDTKPPVDTPVEPKDVDDDKDVADPDDAEAHGCKTDKDCEEEGANPCAPAICAAGKCEPEVAKDGTACEDGDKCTAWDECKGGECTPGTGKDCDDGKSCTIDSCDPATAICKSTNQNDGVSCGEGKACSAGECVTMGDCPGKSNGAPCEDGDTCTKGDICLNDKCMAGKPLVCDEAKACTTMSCESGQGCVAKPVANGDKCDKGDKCTTEDFCQDGTCVAGKNTCGDPCGDGTCDNAKGENCGTCIADCKSQCAAACGDGKCDAAKGENCTACAKDCGACPATCGNGKCEGDESCVKCPLDCGKCAVLCGNKVCDTNKGENCNICPQDCKAGCEGPVCGDGKCESGETEKSCAKDCKAAGPVCGDGKCESGETEQSCAKDCKAGGPVCGDGKCEAGETEQSCAKDCKAGGPVCGDGKCESGEPPQCCAKDCKSGPVCGDGKCDKDSEDCKSCDADCGACKAVCGDKTCDMLGGEDCKSCAKDCGECGKNCGDGKCQYAQGETCKTCGQDCGICLTKAEVGFSVASAGPGLLQGVMVDVGDGSYSHKLAAFVNQPPGTGGILHAKLGALKSQAPFVAKREPAAWLHAVVRTAAVWQDNRQVSAAAAVRDAVGRPQVAAGTAIRITVEAAGKKATATCAANSMGVCHPKVSVPASWFKTGASLTGNVVVSVDGKPALSSKPSPLSLKGVPKFDAAPGSGMGIVLPLGPRLPGTTFTVPLWGYTTGQALESFDVAIKFDTKVLKATSAAIDPKYTGAKNVKASEVLFVAVREGKTPNSQVTGKVKLGTITFKVLSGAKGQVSGVVNSMFNIQNVALTKSGSAVQVNGAGGTSTSGTFTVAANPVRGIFAVADRAEVVNTAPLTGKSVVVAIKTWAVHTAMPDKSASATLTTKSADYSVGAGKVTFSASKVGAGGSGVVDVAFGGFKTNVKTRTWQPQLPVKLAADDKLGAIAGWKADCKGSALRFQASPVNAQATFKAGAASVTARVDHLVTLSVSNGSILKLQSGVVTGLKAGKANVLAKAGAKTLATLAITVDGTPLSIKGLDVVVPTGLMAQGFSPASPFAIGASSTGVARLVQDLKAEFAIGHVFAWAKLSDGKRMPVTEAMGLKLKSLDTKAVGVLTKPPRIKALGTKQGNLVSASWQVCGKDIVSGQGGVKINLPPPTGATLSVSLPRIAKSASDPAAVAGVALESPTVATLLYKNGTKKNFTLDKRTKWDDSSGDPKDLFKVVITKDKNGNHSKVRIVATGKGAGKATLKVTFEHAPKISATATVNVVQHSTFKIAAHPRPAYPGSTAKSQVVLKKVEKTGWWEQARIELVTNLSDGFKIDVSGHPKASFFAYKPGTKQMEKGVFSFKGADVSVIGAGKANVHGSFGGATSNALAMSALDQSVNVTKLVLGMPATFSGQKNNKKQQVKLSATLADGTQYVNALVIPGLVNWSSSLKGKVSVDAKGIASLHDNHNKKVTLIATAKTSGTKGNVQTAPNLTPVVGDIDLGAIVGVAHPDVAAGESFTMPVRVNTGGQSLGSIDVTVQYDQQVIDAVKGEAGSGWPGGQFDVTLNDPPGVVHIVGAAKAGSSASGGGVEVAKIGFKGVKKSGKTTTMIKGFITKLLENTKAQKPIGAKLGPGQTRPIIAGAGLLDPDCSDGSKPADHLGNTNGDCEFSVGDVSYTLFYLAQLVKDGELQSFQKKAMDADGSGKVDVADAVYLLRVLAGKFRFANLTIAVKSGGGGPMATLTATVLDKAGKPVTSKTKVFFHLGTKANKSVKWTQGKLITTTTDGPVVEAKHTTGGKYVAVAGPFTASESKIGVVVVLKSTDTLGKGGIDRDVALFGSPWLSKLSPYTAWKHFSVSGKCTKNSDCIESDGNTCTWPECVAGACKESPAPASAKCDDGDKCTDGDVCDNGVCKAGKQVCQNPCGDKVCAADKGETCKSCGKDCGQCLPAPGCGNGKCEAGAKETCVNCPGDCPKCAAGDKCGDGKCEPPETKDDCPEDCGGGANCGNGKCDAGEDAKTCPKDCAVVDKCGDGKCTGNETKQSCAADCDPQNAKCGDNICTKAAGEDCKSCPADCKGKDCLVCGDQFCDKANGEDCKSCVKDCGECVGGCGDGKCDGANGENCQSCPKDCIKPGSCKCGNKLCDDKEGENSTNCPGDCGTKPKTCGNDKCDPGETKQNCPGDCDTGGGGCNNDKKCQVEKGENCENCKGDCGACLPSCPNKVCEPAKGEKLTNCPQDCGDLCGNNKCDTNIGEDKSNCPDDCDQGGKPCGGSDCADGNSCTKDYCNGPLNKCINEPIIGGQCDDGLSCTTGDKCVAGKCVAGVNNCGPMCKDAFLTCGAKINLTDQSPTTTKLVEKFTCSDVPAKGAEYAIKTKIGCKATHAVTIQVFGTGTFGAQSPYMKQTARVLEFDHLASAGICGDVKGKCQEKTSQSQACGTQGPKTSGCKSEWTFNFETDGKTQKRFVVDTLPPGKLSKVFATLQCGCNDGSNKCGDGKCVLADKEDCKTCEKDCGPCDAVKCGDTKCQIMDGEHCGNCPKDCGVCKPGCGNGKCDNGEKCDTCPQDCGKCKDTCGNNVCDAANGETCNTCPEDCKVGCSNPCGNGKCEPGLGESPFSCPKDCSNNKCGDGQCNLGDDESCQSCEKDCGKCADICPNNKCDVGKGEDCKICPKDCGQCPPKCGDKNCELSKGENCNTCSTDCGKCLPSCGNKKCDKGLGEDCKNCPTDCLCGGGGSCGDGVCDPAKQEDCKSCAKDCMAPGKCNCGNGKCDDKEGETTMNCATDCKGGVKPPSCGNDICEPGKGENKQNCIEDCFDDGGGGGCNNDNKCDFTKGENCETCKGDCGACLPGCPDGKCGMLETLTNCPQDCGKLCGDGKCQPEKGENNTYCPNDCK